MDDMLTDQIEWLLSGNMSGIRLNRHLQLMCGCLGGASLPTHIAQQMAALSRQILLQELFETLINSLNQFSKTSAGNWGEIGHTGEHSPSAPVELSPLLAQIEEARRQLAACDPVNHAEVIGWIIAQARERKIWGRSKRR